LLVFCAHRHFPDFHAWIIERGAAVENLRAKGAVKYQLSAILDAGLLFACGIFYGSGWLLCPQSVL
jgi:uncharacterized membrane protein YbaN (DUF454 family)